MTGKRKILYIKSILLGLGITVLLHFFILLLLAGYNAFNSPFVIPFDLYQMRSSMLFYSFFSLFFYLTVQFLIVFRIQGDSRRFRLG